MKKAFLELDIFSGRKNPRWEFPYKLALELYDQINQLPEARPTKDFDGLGYRGFIFSIELDKESKALCMVFSNRVKIINGKLIQYKKDDSNRIERLFLQYSKNKVEDLIFENIKKEILNPK